MKFSLIVVTDKEWGIGKDGVMPWHLPGELKHFQKVTMGKGKNAVIMGRITWESIPAEHRPLKDRLNIVLTRSGDLTVPDSVVVADSLSDALKSIPSDIEEVFVIGGGRVYHEAIQHPDCEKIYRTVIESDYNCDTFFPKIYEDDFELIEETEPVTENNSTYKFLLYKNKS